MEDFGAFAMIIAIVINITIMINSFLDFLLKRKAIAFGSIDESFFKLLKKSSGRYVALKWGIILLFAGIGLVILGFTPFNAYQSPISWGMETVFIALGFFVYFKVIKGIVAQNQ